MDSLLELLGKYRCHLRRNDKSVGDFLLENFDEYLKDIRNAINPKDNQLVGKSMCEMVAEKICAIEENANQLVEVLRLYYHGKIVPASNKAFEVFESMKPQLIYKYSGAYHPEIYYRIRRINEDTFPLERKELFHIPYFKNYLIGSERYSMPGHPCLYLASQPELCWCECGKPEKFAIAKFDIPQSEDNNFKFIDFSEKLMPLKQAFFCWFHNEENKESIRKYLLKHLCTYPLRAACSVIVEHQGNHFIEEYIIPQLLLQWVLNDEDFDGIRYESCSSFDEVKRMDGHNIVLVTNNFDNDGYDTKLRNNIKVGEPSTFDINSFDNEIKKDPFLWNLEDLSVNYEKIYDNPELSVKIQQD